MAKKQAALLKKLEKTVEGGGEKRKQPPASKPPLQEGEARGGGGGRGREAGMPTDEANEAAVKEMLEGSDAENISMKKVPRRPRGKVRARPSSRKKNEIKGFVVKVAGE